MSYLIQETISLLNKRDAIFQQRQKTLQQTAISTQKKWQRELAAAQKWLSEARAWLARAKNRLDAAIRNVSSCEAAVRRAAAALRSCQNDIRRDKDGRVIYPNCSGYESSLSQAEGALQNARAEQRSAENEVQSAKADVARAEARVALCQEALGHADEAVSIAEQATQQGIVSLNLAERCREEAKAAEYSWKEAKKTSVKQTEQLDIAERHQQTLDTEHGIAQINHRSGEQNGESAQGFGSIAKTEIEIRNDALREFASIPDLPVQQISSKSAKKRRTGSSGSSSKHPVTSQVGESSSPKDQNPIIEGGINKQNPKEKVSPEHTDDSSLEKDSRKDQQDLPNLETYGNQPARQAIKGSAFEQWFLEEVGEHYLHHPSVVPDLDSDLNEALQAIPVIDFYDPVHQQIYELKAYFQPKSRVKVKQLENYRAILDQEEVYLRHQGKTQLFPVKAVTYVFATKRAAIRNHSLISHYGIGVMYADPKGHFRFYP